MLIITCGFAQQAALVFKIDVSCITTQQIVYQAVDVPSLVSVSGSKSVSCWLSWADASRLNNSAQGRDVCEYAYPASKLTIWERCAPELLPVGVGGVPGRGGIVCVGRVEVHLFICVSSMSADCLQCHFGKEGIWTCGFDGA